MALSINRKNKLIENMVNKCEDESSIKNICVDEVRTYNNNYKDRIVRIYREYLDEYDDVWCASLPKYKDVVIGYVKYNDLIIPYTEETTIDTFHHILKNDDNFEFVGDDNDLTFQYLFCFLTSIGFLQPKNAEGEKLFEVYSIFNGFSSDNDINCFIDLTQVIQKRVMPHEKQFYFAVECIKPVIINTERKKLTLTRVADCLAK